MLFHNRLFCIIFVLTCTACSPASTQTQSQNGYDADLAQELGADEYGMRSYVMVILKTGPEDKNIKDKEKRMTLFAGHFSNMGTMAKAGQLVLAGPFADDPEKRGLYIFNVKTIDEAKALVMTDPAVGAGIFTPEFTKYYGSAALMQINDIHATIQKTAIE